MKLPVILSNTKWFAQSILGVGISAFLLESGFAQTTPTLSPNGGTFTAQQQVVVSTPDNGVNLYYTVDGSTPTTNSSVVPPNGGILISRPTNLKIAEFSGTNLVSSNSATFNITGQVATGVYSSAVLRSDGTIWSAGDNSIGELGNGNFTSSATPVQAIGVAGCTAVACGYYHTLALEGDGTVWSWGNNSDGDLGTGNLGINYNTPAEVTGLGGIIAVAAGGYHSLALDSGGNVWAWGYNGTGELGNGGTNKSAVPVQVQGLTNIVAIAAGAYHSLALDSAGNVWGWGNNNDGELGVGNNFSYLTPTWITNGISAIGAGGYHSLFVKTSGTVLATGLNSLGQLGNNSTTGSLVPVQVSGLSGISAVSGGYYFSSALGTNRTVWTWGDNTYNALGTNAPVGNSLVPVQVPSLTNVTGIASQSYHTLAALTNGTVVVWGDNVSGQLGLSTIVATNAPTTSQFVAVAMSQTPSAPTGLLVNYNNASSATLSWQQASTYTESITIQMSSNGGTTWTTVATVNGNATSYTLNGLASGNNYQFRLIANGTYSSSGASSSASPLVNLTITGTNVAPASLLLTASNSGSIGTVSQVAFYEGSQLLGIDTSSPYTVSLANVAGGPHTYTAIASSTNGVVGQGSAAVTVTIPPPSLFNPYFYRYNGTNLTVDVDYVISEDQLQAYGLVTTNAAPPATNALWVFRTALPTIYRFTQVGSKTNYSTVIQNPMATFGAAGGGTPLYTGQTYSFAFCEGGALKDKTNFTVYTNPALSNYNADDFQILVYDKSQFASGQTNVAPLYTNYFSLPHQGTTNWTAFAQSGYVQTNVLNTNGYSLVTTVQFNLYGNGQLFAGSNNPAVTPYTITHSSSSSEYYYIVNYRGVTYSTNKQVPLSVTTTNNATNTVTYNYGYTLDFTDRPAWVSTSLSIPSFQGQPLPSAYAGKSIDELLNVSTPVTYQFAASNASSTNFTSLDSSPELRTNPILDKFVSDMGSNPITLANYILNKIHLSDAIGYNSTGSVSDVSINQGGVSRSALATFLEKEGNPAEQCALLVYCLRKCGVPCGYVFPNHDTLQMLDARMSTLLHLQIGQIVGLTNSAPQILPVNYPWVAAYDTNSNQWVHIFPWMKDTAITEGYDLSDYMPFGYQTGLQWSQHYLTNDPAIMNLNTNDDSLRTLYPLFVNQVLASNGLTMSDVGVTIVDRPHNYAAWSNFPQPWGMVSNSLSSSNLVPNLSSVTNIFDTLKVTVYSDRNTNGNQDAGDPALTTGTVRMVDMHNRALLISTASSTNGTNALSLSLEPLRPGATNTETFPSNGVLINQQLISTNLTSKDNQLYVSISYQRHNQDTNTDFSNAFLSLSDDEDVTIPQRPLKKGDAAVVCLDYGNVTQDMLDADAQKFWAAQQSGTMNTNTAIGTQLQLLGMTYYKHLSDLRQILEPLHKASVISMFGAGLSKLDAQRTSTNTLPTNGVVTLKYPAVDMFFEDQTYAGNETVNPGSGISEPQTFNDLFYLFTVGGSAEEHVALNQFYNQTDSASTVHLLHDAMAQGKQPLILTTTNYAASATNKYVFNGVTNTLQGWAGASMWSTVTNALLPYSPTSTNATEFAPYNIVYITPGPILCASNSYAGVGAMIFSSGSAVSALISSSSFTNPINGGYTYNPVPAVDWSTINNIQSYSSLNQNSDQGYSIWVAPPSLSSYQSFSGNSTINSLASEISGIALSPGSSSFAYNLDPSQVLLAASYAGVSPLSLSPNGSQASIIEGDLASTGSQGPSVWRNAVNFVYDPVDIIRGSFYVNDTDLTIPGPMPIKFTRNYDSMNMANNEFGTGWKMGYFAYLATNALTNTSLIYAAEMDGSVIAYSPATGSTNTWVPMASNNPTLCNQKGGEIGSVFNPFNNKIVLSTSGTATNYTLYGADGSVRSFVATNYPIVSGTNTITRQRPYLQTWVDAQGNTLSFTFGNNTNNPDYGFLNRISASNGNFLQLDYNNYGHIISANAADGRILTYNYDSYGDLVSVTRPDNSQVTYGYQHQTVSGTNSSTHLLIQETKPEGRVLANSYDGSGRVLTQSATVGVGGALTQNATFTYNATTNADGTLSGTNTVTDVYSHTTTYVYSSGQLTQVTDPLNQSITTTWYPAGASGSGAYQRSIASRVDKRGLSTSFSYDSSGNLTNTTTTGNITGSGSGSAVQSAVFNSLNLPTQVTDPVGNYTTYTYGSSISPYLVTAEKHYAAGGGLISETDKTYVNAGSTSSIFANGLLGSVTQAAGSADASTTNYTYNPNGWLASETHLTGTGDRNVSYSLGYNLRGELISKTDAAGQMTDYAYDDLGNRIWEENHDAAGNLVSWKYNYYNQNGEIEWTQGCRYNPTDYTETIYDGAGHVAQKLVWQSQPTTTGVTSGGIATTTYTHDLFGNLTQILDPIGTKTVMTYDAIGQMLTRVKTDANGNSLSSESFTYEPGGKVASHGDVLGGTTTYTYTDTGLPKSQTNADGTSQSWRYLVDGRLSTETLVNGSTKSVSYDDLNRIVTTTYPLYSEIQKYDRRGNLISKTDGEGYTFTTSYDDLNRPKVETGPAGVSTSAQQSVTHSYDSAGLSRTDINALGEQTINSFDAVGRPTQVAVYSAKGTLVRNTSYQYSPDHQSVTVTEGAQATGFLAAPKTTYTDFAGKPILEINQAGKTRYSVYDANENPLYTVDELGNVTSYTYDGLNHLVSQTLPDGAQTTFTYDAAGNMKLRSMPAGLCWHATYDTAGRKLAENESQGSSTTRTYSYTYNTNGNGAGQINTMTDPRGIVTTYSYDSLGRTIQEAAVDPAGQLGVTRSYTLDKRGLLKEVDQSYQNSALSPSTKVIRTLDGYGAIATEQTYINSTLKDTWALNHDAGGHRNYLTELNNPSLAYTQKYDALGHLVENDFAQTGYYYLYNTDGLLYYRNTPVATESIARDGVGRVINSTQSIGGTTLLTENPTWFADSTQATNSISRYSSTSEIRAYVYDARNCLIGENFGSTPVVYETYFFDGGTSGGLGLRTGVGLADIPGQSVATYGTWARLTNMTVSGSLTNGTVGTPVSQSYDAQGNVTNRTAGSITDSLTWDAFGQLVADSRSGGSFSSWSAVYDGLGRRLQTTQGSLVIQSSYDPEHEFLELGLTVNGTRYWKIYGPDLNGAFGGLNGTGGLDGVYNQSTGNTTYLLNDTYGHGELTYTGSTYTWNPSLSDVYGVLPGSARPTAISSGTTDLATLIAWRGKYIDPTGFYYLGARYYAPDSGTFLSPDPLGHATSWDLYSYCNGDPVNHFDPDGRMTLPFMAPVILPEKEAIKASIVVAGSVITYGGGEYIAGLYEAGSFGSGAAGIAKYVAANSAFTGTIGGAANATTQLANTGQINTGELGVSVFTGAVFGSLSAGASLWRSAIVENAGTIESRAATLNSVGSYLGYSAEEINYADTLAAQTASVAPIKTGVIWTADTFGSPVLESQAENKIGTLIGVGENSSSTTPAPSGDPLSAQKATWK